MKTLLCLLVTTLTATWDTVPDAKFYNLYEQVNGAWVWIASPSVQPFKFAANKGTRTYAMTSVNDAGESKTKSNMVTVKVKH